MEIVHMNVFEVVRYAAFYHGDGSVEQIQCFLFHFMIALRNENKSSKKTTIVVKGLSNTFVEIEGPHRSVFQKELQQNWILPVQRPVLE